MPVQCLVQRLGRIGQKKDKILFRCQQGIFFFHGAGDKIIPSRQHLPDRADLGGYVFDAVDDFITLVAENNIAVLSHQLHDQMLPAQISEIIRMLQRKVDDPLKIRLNHGYDPGRADMLAQQHTEIGGGHGTCLVFIGEIDERETCVGRDQQPGGIPVFFQRKHQLIRLRLGDFCDPPAFRLFFKFLYHTCDYGSVKCHSVCPFFRSSFLLELYQTTCGV